jgi:hypothetical protein
MKQCWRNRDFILVSAVMCGLVVGGGSSYTQLLVLPALAVVINLSTMGVRSEMLRSPRELWRPEVWEFSVSGFQVVQHWLAHRMKKGAGKKSSPLDKIRPAAWRFDEELQNLLWVLEHTVDLWPSLAQSLNDILTGDLFTASDFPEPRPEERGAKMHLPLLD